LGEGVIIYLTTTTAVALAIPLVSILFTRLMGMVPAWQDLRDRDLVPFFKAYKATLLASLKRMLIGI